MKTPLALILAMIFPMADTACAQTPPAQAPAEQKAGQTAPPDCKQVSLGEPNTPEQKPAFPDQTRACAVETSVPLAVTVVAKGLNTPWAVEPLPDGNFLITEKPGRFRIVSADGKVGEPIEGLQPGAAAPEGEAPGLPTIAARGQGGLLDVALSPSFEKDRTIFWSFAEQREGGNATSVARGVLSPDMRKLSDVRVIFRALPVFPNNMHFGSRLVFSNDGKLFITLGERSESQRMRPLAQDLNSHNGKVVRIDPDGTVPADNPFVGREGAQDNIWTLGHRNIQSATLDDQGRLWIVEHGARGGDELNLIEPGKNYGWPVITYGEEYSGQPISGGSTAKEGMEQPVYYWDPVIAPSGMEFYTGSAFPGWKGNFFVGGLVSKRLVRLVMKDNRVVGEEHLLTDRGQRIRDVRQGPDGFLYVVTDDANGELLRIAPGK